MTANISSLTWSCPVDSSDISPSITFQHTKLQFFLYLSHNRSLPSRDDCIVVSFFRVLPMGAQACQVLCTISMVVSQTGQKVRTQSSILYFTQNKNVPDDGGVYLITRKCLFESGLVFDGKLTVCCEVTILDNKKDLRLALESVGGTSLSVAQKKALEQYESLLDSGKWSDVTLVCAERQFKLHKAILSAQSPVFGAMFQHSDNKLNDRLELDDVGVKVFETVVRFMYTGKVDSVDENTLELFVAADKYQLIPLKNICAEWLSTALSIESVVNVLVLADMHNACTLKSKCVQFINRNATQVMDTKAWKQMVRDHNSVKLLHELYRDFATKTSNKFDK